MAKYLSNNQQEVINQLKYGKLNKFNLGLYQGQSQGVEWYLELETVISQFKLAEETNQEKKQAYRAQAEQIFQAELEGKTTRINMTEEGSH